MNKTEIQNEAYEAVVKNNYNCVVVLEMGTGKSKLGIDCIKKGNFKNILITSPRTNLKDSWLKELNTWGLELSNIEIPTQYRYNKEIFYITTENIQTTYKWTKEQLQKFDFIIIDEVHLCITKVYKKLILLGIELGIPILGLTGTPDKKSKEKLDFYKTILPIVYEYYDSAKDGLINKRRYFLYKYDLTNDFKVTVNNAKNTWEEGEEKRYSYIENIFNNSKQTITEYYFKEIKARVDIISKADIRLSYKRFFNKITSKDLEYFRKIYWQAMKRKKLPYDLYKNLRYLAKDDYAKFGMKAEYYSRLAPEEIKPIFWKYVWARNKRKEFLHTLTSSTYITNKLKERILTNENNKILLFSELTSQSEKLSNYSVHSNKSDETNKQFLKSFNIGEIRELSSVRTLSLGLNLKKVNWAIVESYNSSDTDVKQKLGRTNRLSVEEVANIIIIIPKNTQSEIWANNYLSYLLNENSEVIEINSIEELICI